VFPAKISVVMPTLNEVENLAEVYRRVKKAIVSTELDYEIIFVDDNSMDGSIELLKRLHHDDPKVKYIIMSRRFGDQSCMMAGLKSATGDAVVTMDSDLQHPPEDLPRMIEQWQKGTQIIIMTREIEGHNSWFKKCTEILFYKTMNLLSSTPIIYRFAGYSLFDRKVVNALNLHGENDPFLRGLIPLVGFSQVLLNYREATRTHGSTKYGLRQMFRLAISGITTFSLKPLYFSFYLGGSAIIISLTFMIYVMISYFFSKSVIPPGWASTILIVIFLGGTQLLSLGIIGIYIGKIFMQVKNRPNYIIAQSGGIHDERD
jgi:glycosyltransferase involved in cell wall biosynthesis